MVRRGQRTQQELRRARREAGEQLDPDRGDYKPPPRESCFNNDWDMPGDDLNTSVVRVNIWRHDGNLVDFVICLEILTSEGWQSVEYIDCCHGYCHYHPKNGAAPRPISRLDVVHDVQTAFSVAQELIFERLRIIRGEGA